MDRGVMPHRADLSVLRAQALERDGGCVWPSRFHEGPLELMHLTHRGMGGDEKVNRLDQVAIGCRAHHDILDGRSVAGRKAAVCDLLAAYLGRERRR